MITHIEIEGFKSLEKVSLDLGALNIFVGTNASGKSNFLEALRVLQGIGYGYTVGEVFNGKPAQGYYAPWAEIRGGSGFATFLGSAKHIQFRVAAPLANEEKAEYRLSLVPSQGEFTDEQLAIDGRDVLDQPNRAWTKSLLNVGGFSPPIDEQVDFFQEQLTSVQAMSPTPKVLREYSHTSFAARMGDHGENFAALIKTILEDDAAAAAYESWLKQLTPAELDSIQILHGAQGDFLFALRKNGMNYPASVLSDGTLRFAAIAAAFFQPELPHILILEEIEDGLHPTRLRLLIELLKSQAGMSIPQVIATSHSPYALAWLKEEDYKFVFLCTKDEETGATSITPFSKIPRLMELARKQPIADLFAEGWLENAV